MMRRTSRYSARRSVLFALLSGLLLVFAPKVGAGGSTTAQYDNPVMHIELSRFFAGATRVSISSDSALIAKNAEGYTIISTDADGQFDASIRAVSQIALSTHPPASDVEASQAGADKTPLSGATDITISPASETGVLSISLPGSSLKWHRYRGAISLSVSAGHLRITNDTPLEEYLCGVLKPEIGASAPIEALKAQAIAARTYAVRNVGHLASEGADLDDTTRTQSYLGVDGETPTICAAVQATAGMVMTYQGQPIEALYSTDCGGVTAQGGPGEPYLQPVEDPDCAAKPAWTKSYTRAQLQAALQKSPQTEVDELRSLSIEWTDASGRASKILISGEDGQSKEVTGAQLRLLLGTEELRSTLFTVKQEEDGSFTFTGHGWGHGLGMCQQGAIALAQGANPQPCDKILKHYYTGIEIVPLTPALVSSVANGGKAPSHEISSNAALSGGKS